MAEGNQTLAANPAAATEVKPLNLAQRMAAIRAESFGIGKTDIELKTFKDGKEKKWTIKSHTVEAVLSEMRPLMQGHGVGLIPMLVSHSYAGNRCDAVYDFEFMDLETGETRTVRWAGSGTDNSDKALAKAGTNALKEMLKKVFLITDRDDAKEEEDKVEHRVDGVDRRELEDEKERTRKLYAEKAELVRNAFKAANSLKEVQRLEREHKAWIKTTPEAMQAFFFEAIEKRKAGFADPTPEEVARAEASDDGGE